MSESTTRTMNEADFVRVLNLRMKENPLWDDLFKSIAKIMTAYVHERATQLSRVRAPQHITRGDHYTTPLGKGKVAYIQRATDGSMEDEVQVEVPGVGSVVIPLRTAQQRNILINGSRNMGFDFFSDTISDADYERVYRYIGQFWPESGTELFVKFIGFIKNMDLDIEQLWTRDAGDNATSDDPEISKYPFLEAFDEQNMIPVWSGLTNAQGIDTEADPIGKDYPTSHVALSYDIVTTPNPNVTDLVNLFYFLAPIHLVLERINAAINVEVPVYAGTAGQLHYYDQAYLTLDSDLNQYLFYEQNLVSNEDDTNYNLVVDTEDGEANLVITTML